MQDVKCELGVLIRGIFSQPPQTQVHSKETSLGEMLYLDTSAVKGDESLVRSLPVESHLGLTPLFHCSLRTTAPSQLAPDSSQISQFCKIAFAAFMERLALIFMAAGKTVQNKKHFLENPLLMSVFYIKKPRHAANLNCECLIENDQVPPGNLDPNQGFNSNSDTMSCFQFVLAGSRVALCTWNNF